MTHFLFEMRFFHFNGKFFNLNISDIIRFFIGNASKNPKLKSSDFSLAELPIKADKQAEIIL